MAAQTERFAPAQAAIFGRYSGGDGDGGSDGNGGDDGKMMLRLLERRQNERLVCSVKS